MSLGYALKPQIGRALLTRKRCYPQCIVRLLSCLTFLLLSPSVLATIELPEEVVFLPQKLMIGSISLETTIFKPKGDGPFPLVVINHGKAPGPAHLQARYRPLSAARYFLERGYVVLVPMRLGFSQSGGTFLDSSCSIKSDGLYQAESIAAAIDYAHTLPYIDKKQTLIVGQSAGGWATLAYGASKPDKSVKGLVNFAGGYKRERCSWSGELIGGAADFGKETTVPAIWFYGDNDSYFPRDVSDAMFGAYRTGNPKAQFVAYGTFSGDSHMLFPTPSGRVIWEPHLTRFLESIGMPSNVVKAEFLAN